MRYTYRYADHPRQESNQVLQGPQKGTGARGVAEILSRSEIRGRQSGPEREL